VRAEVERSWLCDGSRNGSAREGVAGGACFGRSVGSKQLGNGAVTSVAGENHRRGEESDNTDGCAAGPLYHQKGDGGLRATSPRPLLCVQASDAPASMDNGSCSCSWQSVGTSCRNEDDSKIYGIPRLPTGGRGNGPSHVILGGEGMELGGNQEMMWLEKLG